MLGRCFAIEILSLKDRVVRRLHSASIAESERENDIGESALDRKTESVTKESVFFPFKLNRNFWYRKHSEINCVMCKIFPVTKNTREPSKERPKKDEECRRGIEGGGGDVWLKRENRGVKRVAGKNLEQGRRRREGVAEKNYGRPK